MVPATRAAVDADLKHIVCTVLNQDENGDLMDALKDYGVKAIPDLLSIPPADLATLSCKDDTGGRTPLKGAIRNLLPCFATYVAFKAKRSEPVSGSWTSITKDDLDQFRTNGDYLPMAGTGSAPPPPPPGLPITRKCDVVAEFKKSIKRDPSVYMKLKDIRQWDQYSHSTKAHARAQDISQVLDAKYTPSTADDISLFAEKQAYMYSVFQDTLLTDSGKAAVRAHATTYDAQAVFRIVREEAETCTAAKISASSLLTYITSVQWGDGLWSGTASSFIHHWVDQVRLYHSLKDPRDRLTENIQRTMLENAVAPLEALNAVKTQADQFHAQYGRELTLEQYLSLLKSAAASYDKQFEHKGKHIAREVYSTYASASYNIDTPIDILQATAALNLQSPSNPEETGKQNLHDISAHDYLASLEKLRMGSEGDVS